MTATNMQEVGSVYGEVMESDFSWPRDLEGIESKSDTLILNPNYALKFMWFYWNQSI